MEQTKSFYMGKSLFLQLKGGQHNYELLCEKSLYNYRREDNFGQEFQVASPLSMCKKLINDY